jgi:hypothetical protein
LAPLVAEKVYKPKAFRSFRDDSMYREGRVILDSRARRAADKRSDFGQKVQSALWTNHERDVLKMLHAAGADVPTPLAHSSGGILLEFIGMATWQPQGSRTCRCRRRRQRQCSSGCSTTSSCGFGVQRDPFALADGYWSAWERP